MKRIAVLCAALLMLTACQSNPYQEAESVQSEMEAESVQETISQEESLAEESSVEEVNSLENDAVSIEESSAEESSEEASQEPETPADDSTQEVHEESATEEEPAPEAEEPEESEEEAPPVDPEALYHDVIAHLYAIAASEEEFEGAPGDYGVYEVAIYDGLDHLGYTFQDLNGDDVPELLIGEIYDPDDKVGQRIIDIFTCASMKPQLVEEGGMRDRYYLLNDGKTIYNEGSSGAAYSIFAILRLPSLGQELVWEDFYFTYEREEGNYEDIGYYHNTTGIYDKSMAEEMDITDEAFWDLMSEYADQIQEIDFYSFADWK